MRGKAAHPEGGAASGAYAGTMERPLEARGLVKRYGDIVAVGGIDLTVERGDVYGFLGPNGAGKTTTLRIMLGLIRPDAGDVRLFGRDPQHEIPEALDGVGYVLAVSLPPAAAEAASRDLK